LVAAVAAFHQAGDAHGVALASWQVVNLIGAPLVAFLYLPAVVEDVQRWFVTRKKKD
jgi:hypothetical protein